MPPFVLLSLSSLSFVYHLALSCWCVTPSLPPVSSSSHRNNKSGETPPPPPSPISIPRETSRLRGAYNTAALPPPFVLASLPSLIVGLHYTYPQTSSRQETLIHTYTLNRQNGTSSPSPFSALCPPLAVPVQPCSRLPSPPHRHTEISGTTCARWCWWKADDGVEQQQQQQQQDRLGTGTKCEH